jgi:hypothetical protein
MTFIRRVVSGGQTGADQGGLMAAWERGIPTGGWAPREFRTNLGPNPLLEVLGLETTPETGYRHRTCLNVERADATIIFGYDLTSPGSRLTYQEAAATGRPVFCFEFPHGRREEDVQEVRLVEAAADFLLRHRPAVLNVAGNRDTDATLSNYQATRRLLGLVLDLVAERVQAAGGDTMPT